jgi:hypothetical protein
VITDWNNEFLDTVRATSLNPNRTTRAAAILHTAMYDAVNSIAQTHQPYHVNMMADPTTSREAAAAQAAHRVLSSMFPARQATYYDVKLAASLGPTPDAAGISLGIAVGDAILALRANDHANDVVPYVPGSNPGDWIPTPPGSLQPLLPNWQFVTPWAMTSGSQFRDPNGPPALDSAEYTANFLEVKEIGSATSATRNADQSAIARFWASSAGTSTPPGHWMRIAQTVADAQDNTLEENARLFALLSMGMADASVASWDNKYTYNDWRPITAIRAAATDGNPATEADASWNSFLTTPNHPSYTSNHSSVSGAAGAILAEFFGTDNITFTTSSEGVILPDRTFTSFSQASTEAADSRLYGGIHWRYDNEDGLVGGRAVGHYVYDTQLQSIPEPSSIALLTLAAPALMLHRRRHTICALTAMSFHRTAVRMKGAIR